MSEAKRVVYCEGDRTRAIVGLIHPSEEFPGFLEIVRPGGLVLINTRYIFDIMPEQWSDREVNR